MTMLIALLSGQRCQIIHALDTITMVLSNEKCVFYIYELLKHRNQVNTMLAIRLIFFKPELDF